MVYAIDSSDINPCFPSPKYRSYFTLKQLQMHWTSKISQILKPPGHCHVDFCLSACLLPIKLYCQVVMVFVWQRSCGISLAANFAICARLLLQLTQPSLQFKSNQVHMLYLQSSVIAQSCSALTNSSQRIAVKTKKVVLCETILNHPC